jgi:hypothetical protein
MKAAYHRRFLGFCIGAQFHRKRPLFPLLQRRYRRRPPRRLRLRPRRHHLHLGQWRTLVDSREETYVRQERTYTWGRNGERPGAT